jgi:hypothetical protein
MEIVPPVKTSVGLVGMMICFDVSTLMSNKAVYSDSLFSFVSQKFLCP